MTLASIIAMNHAMGADELATGTVPPPAERSHYWHIERINKRGVWKFHSEFIGTKAEMAEHWRKHFLGKKNFRLSHEVAY